MVCSSRENWWGSFSCCVNISMIDRVHIPMYFGPSISVLCVSQLSWLTSPFVNLSTLQGNPRKLLDSFESLGQLSPFNLPQKRFPPLLDQFQNSCDDPFCRLHLFYLSGHFLIYLRFSNLQHEWKWFVQEWRTWGHTLMYSTSCGNQTWQGEILHTWACRWENYLQYPLPPCLIARGYINMARLHEK